MLLALWSGFLDAADWVASPIVDTNPHGGALPTKNRWYAYDLEPEKKAKVDEFVQEYVEELIQENNPIKAIKINRAPIILKQINAEDLIGTQVIKDAINQAVLEYKTYLAQMRERDDERALLLLIN